MKLIGTCCSRVVLSPEQETRLWVLDEGIILFYLTAFTRQQIFHDPSLLAAAGQWQWKLLIRNCCELESRNTTSSVLKAVLVLNSVLKRFRMSCIYCSIFIVAKIQPLSVDDQTNTSQNQGFLNPIILFTEIMLKQLKENISVQERLATFTSFNEACKEIYNFGLSVTCPEEQVQTVVIRDSGAPKVQLTNQTSVRIEPSR